IVDTAILLAIMAPLGFFAMVTAIATFGLLILPFTLAFLGLRFLYYVGFTAGAKSATPGMRMLGIELRTVEGGRPDFLQAFLRLAVYYVLIGLLTPLILLVALFNGQRRALHDMASETVVVNRLAALAA
ncbi:MAG: RDD family protein, partial [Alphaproteobacteria bacterium]|nr:RDD family protein [Alphaproteobacteria bacterium]